MVKKNKLLILLFLPVVLFVFYSTFEYFRTGYLFHIFSTDRFVLASKAKGPEWAFGLQGSMSKTKVIEMLKQKGITKFEEKIIDHAQKMNNRPPYLLDEINFKHFVYRHGILDGVMVFFNNRLMSLELIEKKGDSLFTKDFGEKVPCGKYMCWKWNSDELNDQVKAWERIFS